MHYHVLELVFSEACRIQVMTSPFSGQFSGNDALSMQSVQDGGNGRDGDGSVPGDSDMQLFNRQSSISLPQLLEKDSFQVT